MSAADIVAIGAALTAVLALLLNAYQLSRQRKEQRMALITHLHERFYDDPDMQHIYRHFERGGKLSFERHSVGVLPDTLYLFDDTTERQIDKVLGLLEVAARMYRLDLVGDDEIALIAYEYLTIHQNPGIQLYLRSVEASHSHLRREFQPVPYFREVGDLLQAQFQFSPTPQDWGSRPRTSATSDE